MVLRFSGASSAIKLNKVSAYLVIYPTERKGDFKCSDELLNKIYEISRYTVNLCMEDGFTDCPWRERSQWLGDSNPRH